MMYRLKPPVVFVSDRVAADPRCTARMDRMMTAIDCDRVYEVTDDELEKLIAGGRWDANRRYSGTRKTGTPPIIFNRHRWLSDDEYDAYRREHPRRAGSRFFGFGAVGFREGPGQLTNGNIVCQSAHDLHSISGCLFKCSYCFLEDYLNIMLDVEEWAEHVEAAVDAHDDQGLWKYDNQSDILPFEPEYGVSDILVPLFARKPHAWLMHYTKSDHVDHLLDLDHNGHTIVCWSLSAHTQSRLIEIDAATDEGRIEAGRKCQQAGYPVRYRLSPIVPVRNWRDEYRDLIARLFDSVRPDVVSIQTLSRFPEYDIVERILDTDMLDPRFLEGMRARPDDVRGRKYGPIPHALRREIYEFVLGEIRRADPHVPVSLCLESSQMWDDFEQTLGLDRRHYPCCCGPHSVPGHPVMQPAG